MSEQAMAVDAGDPAAVAAFPVADEHGVFADSAGETIYAPVLNGVCATIQVVEQPDGWRVGWSADLPEGGNGAATVETQTPLATRTDAIVDACEDLIRWLSDEKAKGSKRHQKLAAKTQDWALELKSKMVAEAATPVAAVDHSHDVEGSDGGPLPQQQDMAPQMFPVERLRESPLNPRQYIPEAGIEEMAESIRQGGFRPWLPIVARPCEDGYAEIAAGHRRRLGAIRAGLVEVPCVIRPMSDEEFLDILNFDNTGREDVHPLHEASGWRVWMQRTGKGVLDIAARIGKSKEYVYQRLKYASLTPDAQKAFLDAQFSADHAIRIARRPAEVQKKALAYLKPNPYDGRVPSTRDLDRWLHQSQTMDLAAAPFDREDTALLSGAGTCGLCPKRSGNDPGFVAPEGVEATPDLCTDPRCYGQKLDNHLVRLKHQLAVKGDGVNFPVLVSQNYTTKKSGAIGLDSYQRVDDHEPNARVAIVVEGPDIGKVVKVRTHKSESCALPSAPSGPSPEQVKAAEDRRRVKVERELKIRRAILAAVKAQISGLTRADIEALLIKHFGGFDIEGETICELHGIEADAAGAGEALKAALPKMKENEVYAVVVEAAIVEDLQEWRAEQEPTGLLKVAKRYKVDAAKIRREMDDRAKEAEGGTRREVGKKAADKLPKAAADLVHRLHTGKATKADMAKLAKAPVKKKATKAAPKKTAGKKGGKK